VKRRALTVVLAIVLAIGGTGLVLAYVKQANKRALAGQKAETVLVAKKLIPAGTPASTAQSDGLLQSEQLPAASVPADAVRSISGSVSSLVTSSAIQPGQLLLREALVPASLAQESGGIVVPSGKVAVTVNLCLPEAVANYIHAGSQVNIYDTSDPTTSPSSGSNSSSASSQLTAQPNCNGSHQQQGNRVKTQLILANVEILSVGQAGSTPPGVSVSVSTTSSLTQASSSSSSSSDPSTTLVTFAVTQDQAKQLILVAESGLPYLALLNN
jgi:pilus assembly protein CpaB